MSFAEKQILIASNSLDAPHTQPVAEILVRTGWNIVNYEADRVADGTVPLDIVLDKNVVPCINYGDTELRPEALAAAWLRRPHTFGPHYENEDKASRASIDRERVASQQYIFDTVPRDRWLNAPDNIRNAGRKMSQLVLAKQLGLTVPQTVISNRWTTVVDRFPQDIVAFKSFHGELMENTKSKIVFTTQFPEARLTSSQGFSPYPGMWQANIPKGREWRLTLVGDECFDATVETSKNAQDDWRLHQASSKDVRFDHGRFPDEEKEKCFTMLGHYGLRFGTFDFIEQPDGGLVFLEVNPNGQYQWLEDELGLPISKAVAKELVDIAKAA